MISYAVCRSLSSPGFTVSGTSPRAPRSRWWRTLCGIPAMPRTIPSASANVVGSAIVGPEPMTDGSSGIGPCTSEIAKVSVRADAAASCPPLICERCLRTQLSPSIATPARISVRLASTFSPRVTPGTGAASRADAPPDSNTISAASSVTARRARARASPAATLAGFAARVAGLEELELVGERRRPDTRVRR